MRQRVDDRDGARRRARGRDHGRADDGARRGRAAEILAQIVELQQRLNFAVLFITHDLSLLLEIADRIAVMYAGRIVEVGSAEQIHNRPSHPYTQGLLGSFPSVHGARRELAGIPGSPPDLRALPPGCPFVPRCAHATRAVPRASTCASSRVSRRRRRATSARVRSSGRRPTPTPPPRRATADAGRGTHERAAATPAEVLPAAAERGPLVLEAHALTKDFRLSHGPRGEVLSAARGVSFGLYRSAVVALVGESGSGKSTVARMLAGQERPTDGEILLDGAAVRPGRTAHFRAYKSDVQMVFQDPFASLNAVHTVRYALRRPVRLHQHSKGQGGDRGRARAPARAGATDAGRQFLRASIRTSSPAASASASRSRARSPRGRGCCWPTSRSRCSTSRSASRCSTCSTSCAPSSSSRSCTSPTTSPRHAISPTTRS